MGLPMLSPSSHLMTEGSFLATDHGQAAIPGGDNEGRACSDLRHTSSDAAISGERNDGAAIFCVRDDRRNGMSKPATS